MKQLLSRTIYAICILLLTCTFCLAQRVDEMPCFKHETTLDKGTEVDVRGAEMAVIKLLAEYERECYNDSTEVVWAAIIMIGKTDLCRSSFDSLKSEFPDDLRYLYSTYEHKEPEFADFVRWAAKKYCL